MRSQKKWFGFLFGVVFLLNVSSIEASVILNEIFADPPAGLIGDSNNDGVRSSSADEFVELLNYGIDEVDISNWYLSDNISIRHIFPPNTILSPYTFLAVFGGGAPNVSGIHWQIASSGSLGLNNSGDSVTLFDIDGQLIDQVVYGNIGGNDQSITLFPDGEGSEFFLHSNIEQAQGALFSPGTSIDSRLSLAVITGDENSGHPVVPELPTLAYLMFGWAPFLFRGKWVC